MDNEIKKQALKILADAPKIAAIYYIKSLSDENKKKEAITLFKALNVIKKEV